MVRPDEDGGEGALAMLGPGEVLESKDLGHVGVDLFLGGLCPRREEFHCGVFRC